MTVINIGNLMALVFLCRCFAEDSEQPPCKPRKVIREFIDDRGINYFYEVYRCSGATAQHQRYCVPTTVKNITYEFGGNINTYRNHTQCESNVCPDNFQLDCDNGMVLN